MYHHGVMSVAELRAAGYDAKARRELTAAGQLRRIRRGWLAMPAASADAVRAIELGGRLGCVSGCRAHGLWVPPISSIHIMLNPGAAVPRAGNVELHRLKEACHSAVAPVDECLSHVLHRHHPETGLVVLESALELGRLELAEARGLIASAPSTKQGPLRLLRPGAGSGSETRVRLFFQQRRVPVSTQVPIAGLGRVDMVVGRSLIVECDSHAHHSSPAQQEEDRRRDLAARELGYAVIRLSYSQVWHTWGQTKRLLSAELGTRAHRRRPRPLAAAG